MIPKKDLMVQFCIAYSGILSHHNLCATGTTGKMVSEATGLEIFRFLSGTYGGDRPIIPGLPVMRSTCCFSSGTPLPRVPPKRVERTCFACAMSTIFLWPLTSPPPKRGPYPERGNLDWRDIVNPSRSSSSADNLR